MATWQRVKIEVPKDLGPSEREELGAEVIEFIVNRSRNGVGIRKKGRGFQNFRFPEYTKEYASKKKVSVNNVDLTLSTEMLESIELLSHVNGELTIGFQKGDDINGKAQGNALGSYGRSPNKKKARPFLGITRNDLLDLL